MVYESGEYDKTHIIGDLLDPAYIFFIVVPKYKTGIIFKFFLKASCHVSDEEDFFIARFYFLDETSERQDKIFHGICALLSYCIFKRTKRPMYYTTLNFKKNQHT